MEYCFNFRRRWHFVNSFHDMAACICPKQLLTCTPNNITHIFWDMSILSFSSPGSYLFVPYIALPFLSNFSQNSFNVYWPPHNWLKFYNFLLQKFLLHILLQETYETRDSCVLWDKYKAHKRNHPSRLQITLLL